MLKVVVLDCTKQFRLEQEVSKPGVLPPDVAPAGKYKIDITIRSPRTQKILPLDRYIKHKKTSPVGSAA
jgi:hypothetical protein